MIDKKIKQKLLSRLDDVPSYYNTFRASDIHTIKAVLIELIKNAEEAKEKEKYSKIE